MIGVLLVYGAFIWFAVYKFAEHKELSLSKTQLHLVSMLTLTFLAFAGSSLEWVWVMVSRFAS